MRRLFAECMGTAWLVLGGCGAAVLAAGFPEVGIGLLGAAADDFRFRPNRVAREPIRP